MQSRWQAFWGWVKRVHSEWRIAARPAPGDQPSSWHRILPFWLRATLLVAFAAAAFIWRDDAAAAQIGWTLAYGGAIAVSFAIAFWVAVFIVDAVLAAAWYLVTVVPETPPRPERNRFLWPFTQIVELLNRLASNLQAFWIWMALAMSSSPKLTFQIPTLLAVVLFGGGIVDTVTRKRNPGIQRATGELQSRRRPLIYLLAVIGLVILTGRTWDGQFWNVFPLAAALSIGVLVRYRRHGKRKETEKLHHDDVKQFRRKQSEMSRHADVIFGPLLTFASIVALSWLAMAGREQLHDDADAGPLPPENVCEREAGGPVEPAVTLFVMADSQFHELGGHRFPGQTELADVLVPSAVRPVELDMLSSVALAHFGEIYKSLHPSPVPLFWAHLGDLSDNGCHGEIDRALKRLTAEAFHLPELAGIAPGNHDMSFTGNFGWSPYWGKACPTGRLDKAGSIEEVTRGTGNGAQTGRVDAWWPTWLGGGPHALVKVTVLGKVDHDKKTRTLVGVFVDTADRGAFDWGVAGIFGTFSRAQERELRAEIEALGPSDGDFDPIFLVFAHHRIEDMTPASAGRLRNFLGWLDDDPLGRDPDPDELRSHCDRQPRLLALVAAHTHHAESHWQPVNDRSVREIVVGSTIDPPEQAAILDIGTDADGMASLRLRTVPSVERRERTCEHVPLTLAAGDCLERMATLRDKPECAALFEEIDVTPPTCSQLEEPLSPWQKWVRLAGSSTEWDPHVILERQRARARNLLGCMCGPKNDRFPSCVAARNDPFAGEIYADVVKQTLEGPVENRKLDLVCLAWAASAVQAHKAAGMTLASALRCSFDDATIPAAKDLVVSLEKKSCR